MGETCNEKIKKKELNFSRRNERKKQRRKQEARCRNLI
jgi:hypothetical protein